MQYIEVAKQEKADALVGRIIARCVLRGDWQIGISE